MASVSDKAAALEGLDFIETEEDVKAVEAATLKIQSTFRGKKIRSKVTPKPAAADKADEQQEKAAADSSENQVNNQSAGRQKSGRKSEEQQESRSSSSSTSTSTTKKEELELSKKVADMQVQDNTNNQMENQKTNVPGGLPEEERAATKIQAGFKGYKTRKELEGKLPAAVGSAAGQQEAPAAAGNSS